MMPGGPALPNSGKPGTLLPGFRPAYAPPPSQTYPISSPPVPPPMQFTNAGNPLPGGPAMPNRGLPGQILPGFNSTPPLIQLRPALPPDANDIQPALPGTHAPNSFVPGYGHINQTERVVLPYPPITIFGVMDGVNPLFTWQVAIRRGDVMRNGLRQTLNVDVCVGPTSMKFLPGSIPQPGDVITMWGWV